MDARLQGATVVASVSGGKDSAAMCLYLREMGIEPVRIFADTGWEHRDTYDYLRGPLTDCLGPITELRGRDGGMAPLIRRKGTFPSRLRRFCTEELKVKPIAKFLGTFNGSHPVNVVGIRRAESVARSKMEEWEWSEAFDCWVWRPIIDWSEQQVVDIHRRHGLAPNPLYLRGAERVGCWPCIFARKREIRLVADESPERIAEIAAMEDALPENPAKLVDVVEYDDHGIEQVVGTKLLPPMKKTYFHGLGHRDGTPVSIDEAVRWSRTKPGTKDQGVLFHDLGEPAGCVRWGLCEPSREEEDR